MNLEVENNKSVFKICLRKDLLLVFLCLFVFKHDQHTCISILLSNLIPYEFLKLSNGKFG